MYEYGGTQVTEVMETVTAGSTYTIPSNDISLIGKSGKHTLVLQIQQGRVRYWSSTTTVPSETVGLIAEAGSIITIVGTSNIINLHVYACNGEDVILCGGLFTT